MKPERGLLSFLSLFSCQYFQQHLLSFPALFHCLSYFRQHLLSFLSLFHCPFRNTSSFEIVNPTCLWQLQGLEDRILSHPIVIVLASHFQKEGDILLIIVVLSYSYICTIIILYYSKFVSSIWTTASLLMPSSPLPWHRRHSTDPVHLLCPIFRHIIHVQMLQSSFTCSNTMFKFLLLP